MLFGQNADSDFKVKWSQDLDSVYTEVRMQDNAFVILIDRALEEVFIQFEVDETSVDKSFTINWNKNVYLNLKEENQGQFDKEIEENSTVLLKNNTVLNCLLDNSFEEQDIYFESSDGKHSFTLKIKKDKTDLGVTINGDLATERKILSLGTFKVGDPINLEIDLCFESLLNRECKVEYDFNLPLKLIKGDKKGTLNFIYETSLEKEYLARDTGTFNGEIIFKYDCPQVNEKIKKIPVSFEIQAKNLLGSLDWTLVAYFLIPFISIIVTALIVKYFVQWKRKKGNEKLPEEGETQSKPESNKNVKVHKQPQKFTSREIKTLKSLTDQLTAGNKINVEPQAVVTLVQDTKKTLRNQLLDDLVKNNVEDVKFCDFDKIKALRNKWLIGDGNKGVKQTSTAKDSSTNGQTGKQGKKKFNKKIEELTTERDILNAEIEEQKLSNSQLIKQIDQHILDKS